ncbi:MAG: AAA family ATPase [Pirellulaceae bacterium]
MIPSTDIPRSLYLGTKLTDDVLAPMKRAFVGKDEVIDLLGVCLVARENLFILGPPGTAKSALVQDLARRLDGRAFDYLLTRFTEPNELFGPFDIRKLREGELTTNTEGMLPEADVVFLDELLNANSAILNSLLLVLNERIFRRGRETRRLPTLMVVGASNRLPDDEALGALFDRFLLRVCCGSVAREELADVLVAGWRLDQQAAESRTAGFALTELRQLQQAVWSVDLEAIRQPYVELIHRLRHAGIAISDRRAVKLQRLMAASALLCGRSVVDPSDLWIMRYTWDMEEQQDVLKAVVQEVIRATPHEPARARHPRSGGVDAPDPERLARDLERLSERATQEPGAELDRVYMRDQLGLLASRCQWISDEQPRRFLENQVNLLWEKLGGRP